MEFIMSFVIITGPTNAGKTTYASTLASHGTKIFNFDNYYHKRTEKVIFTKRQSQALEAILKEALEASNQGFNVVCEGSQFMLPLILKKCINELNSTSLKYIFLAPSVSQTLQNLDTRNKGRSRKKIIYLEQFIFSVISYIYFHLKKSFIYSKLKNNGVTHTTMNSIETRIVVGQSLSISQHFSEPHLSC